MSSFKYWNSKFVCLMHVKWQIVQKYPNIDDIVESELE